MARLPILFSLSLLRSRFPRLFYLYGEVSLRGTTTKPSVVIMGVLSEGLTSVREASAVAARSNFKTKIVMDRWKWRLPWCSLLLLWLLATCQASPPPSVWGTRGGSLAPQLVAQESAYVSVAILVDKDDDGTADVEDGIIQPGVLLVQAAAS